MKRGERASERTTEQINWKSAIVFCTMKEHVMVIDCQAKIIILFIWERRRRRGGRPASIHKCNIIVCFKITKVRDFKWWKKSAKWTKPNKINPRFFHEMDGGNRAISERRKRSQRNHEERESDREGEGESVEKNKQRPFKHIFLLLLSGEWRAWEMRLAYPKTAHFKLCVSVSVSANSNA